MTTIIVQPIDFTGFLGTSVTKLLINRLEYWFRGKKKNHFFKFLCPCDHTLYRKGDSWTEELGISRQTFKRHFDRIGTRWESKSAFNKAEDPFLGKPYACYYDRKENITRYFKNSSISLKAFSGSILSRSAHKEEKEVVQRQADKKIEKRKAFKPSTLNGQSRGTKMASPLYTHKTTDKSKYLSSNTLGTSLSVEEEKITKEIQEVWKKEVGGRTYTSQTFLKKLYKAFKTLFKGSLEAWKSYCRKIASSKFLMGEVSSFKAWISWAIREETYEKLEAGEYTLGDRVSEQEEREKTSKMRNDLDGYVAQKLGKNLEFHKNLRKRVGDATYAAWFKDLKLNLYGEKEKQAEIQASSTFSASYIRQNFSEVLEEIICPLLGANKPYNIRAI